MTQDKAPEWAKKQALMLFHGRPTDVEPEDAPLVSAIALALSQAYERGQVDMMSAFEKIRDETEIQAEYSIIGFAIAAIRSLPIDSGKDA